MNPQVDVAIIGAGPYGLAAAAVAKELNLSYTVFGSLGSFWREHMPRGMLLRSGVDWHVDPLGVFTFEKFVQDQHLSGKDIIPIPLNLFLAYLEWFKTKRGLELTGGRVAHLSHDSKNNFFVISDNRHELTAKRVVIATGLEWFRHIPDEYLSVPNAICSHTADHADLSKFSKKRIAIIGGRQSAFETAAILGEQSRDVEIHLIYRHETPRFVESDWSFMDEMYEALLADSAWYAKLSLEKKDYYKTTAFKSGRLQLEEWLWPRVDKPFIHLHEKTKVDKVNVGQGQKPELQLNDGNRIEFDHLIFATGYKVDLRKMPFLDEETISSKLTIDDGCPKLTGACESNIPGLHCLGMLAVPSYGYPFGFVKGAPLGGILLKKSWAKHS